MASAVRDDSVKTKRGRKRAPKAPEVWMKEISALLHSLAASVEDEDKMEATQFQKVSSFLKSRLEIALYRMSLVADANSGNLIAISSTKLGLKPGYRQFEQKPEGPYVTDDGEGNIVRVAGGPRRAKLPESSSPATEKELLEDVAFIDQ